MRATKAQIIDYIANQGRVSPSRLAKHLGISTQALHRHLKDLCASKHLIQEGMAPRTVYRVGEPVVVPYAIQKEVRLCGDILGTHPGIVLATLFGSQARNQATPKSDVDVLVWLHSTSRFNRHDIWQFWDRQGRLHVWKYSLSLIVRQWSSALSMDTLLLDFPEEHIVLFDRSDYYSKLREAIVRWRHHWGAQKISSFGGSHFWKYSTKVRSLQDIDFRLEIKDVAKRSSGRLPQKM